VNPGLDQTFRKELYPTAPTPSQGVVVRLGAPARFPLYALSSGDASDLGGAKGGSGLLGAPELRGEVHA
jgi:hypothetical protein